MPPTKNNARSGNPARRAEAAAAQAAAETRVGPGNPQEYIPRSTNDPVGAVGAVAGDPYAPTQWGTTGRLEDVICPSGQRCLARRPGLQGLIAAGVIDKVDSLSAIVDQKHIKRMAGKQTKDIDARELMKDKESLQKILDLADQILVYVVVKPEILPNPARPEDRDETKIYADMVDLQDKMFLLNYAVGGTRDLERFRGELEESLGSLDFGKDVEQEA